MGLSLDDLQNYFRYLNGLQKRLVVPSKMFKHKVSNVAMVVFVSRTLDQVMLLQEARKGPCPSTNGLESQETEARLRGERPRSRRALDGKDMDRVPRHASGDKGQACGSVSRARKGFGSIQATRSPSKCEPLEQSGDSPRPHRCRRSRSSWTVGSTAGSGVEVAEIAWISSTVA